MNDLKQADRLLTIDTVLGADMVLAQSVTGSEGISELFSYAVTVLAKRDDIGAEELVGTGATMTLRIQDGKRRYLHGMIQRLVAGEPLGRDLRIYTMTLVPWLWFLTRTTDCRIFQGKSVPKIAEDVFREMGFQDFDLSGLRGSYQSRDFCVQYRETDFAFLSRLFEEEGIFYFFRHADGNHTLVLADHPGAFPKCDDERLKYSSTAALEYHINEWEHQYEYRSGSWAHGDFNFETPKTDLTSQAASTVMLPSIDTFELYDFPGLFQKKDTGKNVATIRIEEDEMGFDVVRAGGTCRSLFAGSRFTLVRHDVKAEEKGYVVVTLQQHATAPSYLTGQAAAVDYGNRFLCVPDTAPFRPTRRTARPVIPGVQTAIVVGPKGDEIYPDKYGRIKVQFHWDRRGKYDEKSSCWIRVAQDWAGRRWGRQRIPRIGMEVVVQFLEGNPDRPLVVGVVNNADNMPPYNLPDEKTKSTLKTNSSPGGDGFNELRFEDKKGKEQVFVHAERDLDVRVKARRRDWIGGSHHTIVKKNRMVRIDGESHLTVKGDHQEKFGGGVSRKVGMEVNEEVGMNFLHKAGQNIVMEAGMMISFKVGGNFITIGPTGVTINGTMVLINSGGMASPLKARPEPPDPPEVADEAKPGEKVETPSPKRLPAPGTMNPKSAQARVMRMAAQRGTPLCETCSEGR